MSESPFSRLQEQLDSLHPPSAEQVEKEIATVILQRVDIMLRQMLAQEDLTRLCECVHEQFGADVSISPVISLVVTIGEDNDEGDQSPPATAFSAIAYDKALREIWQKDFSTCVPEDIMRRMNDTIEQIVHSFMGTIVITHPLLRKIIEKFRATYARGLIIEIASPVNITVEHPDIPPKEPVRGGLYL